MKKLALLTAMVTAAMTGTAFAASVPVTTIGQGQSTVAAEYSFAQHGSQGNGTNEDGYGASLNTGLTNNLNVGYSFSKVNMKHTDLKDQQLAATYAVTPHINLYGAGTYVKAYGDHNFGVQGGVIGYMPIADRLQGYAKVGVGDDVKQTYQAGVSYGLAPDVDLNMYYQYDKYNVSDKDTSVRGLHAGVGYSF